MPSSILIKEEQKPVKCFQCAKALEVHWKCNECAQVYCNACRAEHDKVKILQSHTWLKLTVDAAHEPVADKAILCDAHTSTQVQFYCFDCKALLCSLCLLKDHHEGHQRKSIANAAIVFSVL